jgi:hypothetical protein
MSYSWSIEEKIMPFGERPEGLHYYRPNIINHTAIVQNVEDKKAFYTSRQVDRAKKARDLLHTLRCPTVADMKKAIKMNSIMNCPVSVDDVNLDEKIHGPDVASLKGKSTRSRPIPVINDIIEIPKELIAAQNEVDLCIDTLFINSLPFLATVSKNMKYRTCYYVKSIQMSDYRSAIDQVIKIYSDAGFTIKCIHTDNEYEPLIVHFKNHPPHINYNLALPMSTFQKLNVIFVSSRNEFVQHFTFYLSKRSQQCFSRNYR